MQKGVTAYRFIPFAEQETVDIEFACLISYDDLKSIKCIETSISDSRFCFGGLFYQQAKFVLSNMLIRDPPS